MNKILNIKKGDIALVIAGKDKGKSGKVVATSPKTNKVVVEGMNIATKHQKARSQQDKSKIVKVEAPFNASNCMVICSACSKATRVAKKEVEGKNVRVCKKCGAILDKAFIKESKKDSKKEIKKTESSKKDSAAPKVKPVKKDTAVKSQTKSTVKATVKKTAPSSGK